MGDCSFNGDSATPTADYVRLLVDRLRRCGRHHGSDDPEDIDLWWSDDEIASLCYEAANVIEAARIDGSGARADD